MFLAEARKVALTGFEVGRVGDPPRLEATVRGVRVERPGAFVKAATFHGLRIEERALTTAMGDRYRDFAASRARLIPYVW